MEDDDMFGWKAGFWMAVAIILMLVFCTSCKTIRYVPVETVRTDSIYLSKIERDSIYFRDSVYVRDKGDTVIIYKDRYIYRYRTATDTIFVERRDSVMVPMPVEQSLSKWERVKMDCGGMAIGACLLMALIIVGWLVYKRQKK